MKSECKKNAAQIEQHFKENRKFLRYLLRRVPIILLLFNW
jgi:hypothetical protein